MSGVQRLHRFDQGRHRRPDVGGKQLAQRSPSARQLYDFAIDPRTVDQGDALSLAAYQSLT